MLSRSLGGMEQAFVDYSQALSHQGIESISVIDAKGLITKQMTPSASLAQIYQYTDWDPRSIANLRGQIKSHAPDVIICHGNRPLKLVHRCGLVTAKVVGVLHNFSIKHMLKADYVFSVSNHIIDKHLVDAGYPKSRVSHIPNMVRLEDFPIQPRPSNHIPIIGTMGRFVEKKGFDDFLKSIALMKRAGHKFKAILGGSGEMDGPLRRLAYELDLNDCVEFRGWVDSKKDFFSQVDVFCLPSREEPFGITALEAMAFGCPIVSTNTTGPMEFLEDGKNCLVAEAGNLSSLARTMATALDMSTDYADKITTQARRDVAEKYSLTVVSGQLKKALDQVVGGRN